MWKVMRVYHQIYLSQIMLAYIRISLEIWSSDGDVCQDYGLLWFVIVPFSTLVKLLLKSLFVIRPACPRNGGSRTHAKSGTYVPNDRAGFKPYKSTIEMHVISL